MTDAILEFRREGPVLVGIFQREVALDESTLEAFRRALDEALEGLMGVKLLVDFGNVSYLSSVILGALIRLHKHIQNQDGVIKICALRPPVRQVFQLTRLDKIFDLRETLADGLAAFRPRETRSV